MWWLNGRDVLVHWSCCGGSLVDLWWLNGGVVVGHWGNCGGSLGELWWVIGELWWVSALQVHTVEYREARTGYPAWKSVISYIRYSAGYQIWQLFKCGYQKSRIGLLRQTKIQISYQTILSPYSYLSTVCKKRQIFSCECFKLSHTLRRYF